LTWARSNAADGTVRISNKTNTEGPMLKGRSEVGNYRIVVSTLMLAMILFGTLELMNVVHI
jgi:hypothetical protein